MSSSYFRLVTIVRFDGEADELFCVTRRAQDDHHWGRCVADPQSRKVIPIGSFQDRGIGTWRYPLAQLHGMAKQYCTDSDVKNYGVWRRLALTRRAQKGNSPLMMTTLQGDSHHIDGTGEHYCDSQTDIHELCGSRPVRGTFTQVQPP